MSSAHIVTLCVYVLTLAGPANGMLGPGVDFNPESFHWAMTDVLTNAGFKRMEGFLQDNVKVIEGHMNPVSYLLPLAYKALETTKTRMAVVMSLRENVSLMYPSFARWSPFQECCVINKRKLIYNYQYKAFASILEMCYEAPPWYHRDPDRLYPPVDLRRVFMQNKRQDQRLYWQFFASESGLFTVFPATLTDLRKHCHYDDPRLKRWYTDVIAPPKDFVLLVDKSADMAEKLSTAKDVAKLLIRTANSRDSISVFGFSGGKITDPEMTDFHLVSPFTTATPSVQRELMRFVDTLTPEGDSVYRGGIIEALSRLSSQDSSERHSSRVVVIVSGAECVDSKTEVLMVIDKELTTRNMTAQFITFNVDSRNQRGHQLEHDRPPGAEDEDTV